MSARPSNASRFFASDVRCDLTRQNLSKRGPFSLLSLLLRLLSGLYSSHADALAGLFMIPYDT